MTRPYSDYDSPHLLGSRKLVGICLVQNTVFIQHECLPAPEWWGDLKAGYRTGDPEDLEDLAHGQPVGVRRNRNFPPDRLPSVLD